MTVAANKNKYDHIRTIIIGFLCLIGLILTIIALFTPSWTINEYSSDGEVHWHGPFKRCNRFQCISNSNQHVWVIFLTITSTLLLLCATISVFLMVFVAYFRRYFYLAPLFVFLSLLLHFIGIVVYTHRSIINGICARLMLTSIVFACLSLAMMSYIAGRYTAFYPTNRTGYQLTKTENTEVIEVQTEGK
ncbi:unnamed protein product [Rotaria socialis]|uniref:Uncharacterized protein n=1 Tax=Rotaria socialis TaxID=392032 RepID=A0A819XTF7_9BILA|nr:unnamed protein product [Rotaria socialis]CAF3721526.1 unnamed protein product [Rotaria socialis]CAF4144469.1 unnamed protein product [Rotaria socialis]CAF4471055.1 unnamed protein product [Rotaria socialis]